MFSACKFPSMHHSWKMTCTHILPPSDTMITECEHLFFSNYSSEVQKKTLYMREIFNQNPVGASEDHVFYVSDAVFLLSRRGWMWLIWVSSVTDCSCRLDLIIAVTELSTTTQHHHHHSCLNVDTCLSELHMSHYTAPVLKSCTCLTELHLSLSELHQPHWGTPMWLNNTCLTKQQLTWRAAPV